MFDRDKDGVLTVKELQLVLRCLGLRPSMEQVKGDYIRDMSKLFSGFKCFKKLKYLLA